jgi:hypothetical protein
MMRRMMGRLLAICGWLAWQVGRVARSLPRAGAEAWRTAAAVMGAVLLLVTLVPIVLPQLDAQPQTVTVQQIMDGAVTEASGWVRLSGSTVPLEASPTGGPGRFGILADDRNPLRSIVVEGNLEGAVASAANVTGHITSAVVTIDPEQLPIEATVAGTPPQIVTDRIVTLDDEAKPMRSVVWPLSIPPLLIGAMLLVGARVGYPIFRQTFEVDVLAGPLGPGERVPAAFGGRVGPNVHDLADPGAALLLVRRGPKGNVLTAQPLADSGPAPAPVAIGGGWTSGQIGYVYTVNESVPALTIRSDEVDATFLFARTSERDRIAALVAVSR